MAINYKQWNFSTLAEREMSPEMEGKYLEACRLANADILAHAKKAADASALYWTDADQAIFDMYPEVTARLHKVERFLFNTTGPLGAVFRPPVLLTQDLADERRAVMLEACEMYRSGLYKYGGELGAVLADYIDELERKANSVSVHNDAFDPSKYV